ncbi:hypothetical protein [Paenibacillus sp. FSL R7-0179]|uniref:hypothetical protein n=2 Tax=unclassified Paenibacillus TaxID=185978 RepID=UPI0030FAF023
MKKMKILASLGLSLAIAFVGVNPSVYAAETKPTTEVITETSDIYSKEGDLIGSVAKTHTVKIIEATEGLTTTVTTTRDFTLLPEYENVESYKTIFQDDSTTSEIFYDNLNHKILVNDEELNIGDLNAVTNPLITPLQDTGGITWLSHYYSTNDLSSYVFTGYQSMNYNWIGNNNSHGEPEGAHVYKSGIKPSNTWFPTTKNAVDLFSHSYADFRQAQYVMYAEAVASGWTGAILLWTGWGWVAAGAPVAVLAGITINSFNTAKNDMQKAYTYMVKL